MKSLSILVALCVLTAAMVPREKRALNTEEDDIYTTETIELLTSTQKPMNICQPRTPCGWTIYKPVGTLKIIHNTVNNSFCTCSEDKDCLRNEDDTSTNVFTHYCLQRDHET